MIKYLISKTPRWIKNTYIAPLLLCKIREIFIQKRKYNQLPKKEISKMVVYCIDDNTNRAGLSDRIWSFIATYIICMKHNMPFKANWIYPFDIKLFLEPNDYDWSVDESELSFSRSQASPLVVTNNHNEAYQIRLLERILHKKTPQVHVNAIAHLHRNEFGKYFRILFKPSPMLKKAIDANLEAINGKYVSVTFRFQQLLGDFKEGNYPILEKEERDALLFKSLRLIEQIKERHPEVQKILVTSDSKTLLEESKKMPFVYVIPGEIVHMGYTSPNATVDKHIKSFVDFFMISKAEKVYFAKSSIIYPSTFALTASKVNEKPYEEVEINL